MFKTSLMVAVVSLVIPALTWAQESPGEWNALQAASLEKVFYSGAPMPPAPSQSEKRRFRKLNQSALPGERRRLHRIFLGDQDLVHRAMGDRDNDGVNDFRVTDEGKFMEGDLDIDGDGIRNLYDVAPFDDNEGGIDLGSDGIPDEAIADSDLDGIPDHVDWNSDESKTRFATETQTLLFQEFGVLLVERGAAFSDELLQAISDAFQHVFRGPYEQNGVLEGLRTIALCNYADLTEPPEVNEENLGPIEAQVLLNTQTIEFYEIMLEMSPLEIFINVTHELTHGYQASLDYVGFEPLSPEKNRQIYFDAPRFYSLLRPFGWTIGHLPPEELFDEPVLFQPEGDVQSPREYFHEYPPETWITVVQEVWTKYGSPEGFRPKHDYLGDRTIRRDHVVGEYAVMSAFEWHAVNLESYVLNQIESYLRAQDSSGPGAAERFHRVIRSSWPHREYRNLLGHPFMEYAEREFPISESSLQTLVENYVTH